MITIEGYYKNFRKSTSNSSDLIFEDVSDSIFPIDGLYVGKLISVCGDEVPALIPIHKTNGLCFLSTPETEDAILTVMQMMALRFICSVPSSKCKLILYDGQRLGENLLYLAELDHQIIGDEIYTSCEQFKNKLKQIRKEITDRITHTLGSKFKGKTIVEYNEQAGILSLPYYLIVISNFPYTLDKESTNILKEIIRMGSRVGVYVITNIDTQYDIVSSGSGFNAIDVTEFLNRDSDSSMDVIYKVNEEDRYYLKTHSDNTESFEKMFNSFSFILDETVPDNIGDVKDFLLRRTYSEQVQKLNISYLFTHDNFWSKSSSEGIDIPIGKDDNDKILNFSLGYNSFHAKVGGMTGTGKSVVLHNIIANGAWLYSPDELQFILMDFKDGIGFRPYVDLPHTRILSDDKNPSFAKNVFDYILEESSNRNHIFNECGVDNFADYKSVCSSPMPRLLIIIDEFTSMYFGMSSSDTRQINEKIDQIARTVRSTGINMIICTQGLKSLDVELSQFSLGIGLRFQSERDKRFISSDYQFPKGMKAGDAIYCENDSPVIKFRVAYMKNDKVSGQMLLDDRIANINASAKKFSKFNRFIYHGKTQVDFVPARNKGISIGLPILEKNPVEITFNNENGSNLLIVGHSREAASSIFYHTIKQLISSEIKKKIYVCDKMSNGNSQLSRLTTSNENICTYITEDDDITSTLEGTCGTIKIRETKEWNTEIYLFIFDSFNFGKGRRSESGRTTKEIDYLMGILRNGAAKGVHLIVYADSFSHYQSTFGYDSLGEWRIKSALAGEDSNKIFSSRDDSYSIIEDSPYAAIVDFGRESKTKEILTFKI